jgi:outer membrane protein OmpA-like peptidoglycan-associated protein
MRIGMFVLACGLMLAGCDAPAPAPASDSNLAAQTQTSVVTVPDAGSGPVSSPPAESPEQLVISTATPPAQDLKVIQFASGSDGVSDAAVPQLARYARYLAKFRKSVILTGYTRRMPDLAAAKELSSRRAEAVRRFLILHDVGAVQIEANGRGDAQLVDQGTTENAMARNDRVELELVDAPTVKP